MYHKEITKESQRNNKGITKVLCEYLNVEMGENQGCRGREMWEGIIIGANSGHRGANLGNPIVAKLRLWDAFQSFINVRGPLCLIMQSRFRQGVLHHPTCGKRTEV